MVDAVRTFRVGAIAVLVVVCVLVNLPARMMVDGRQSKWFVPTVPEPERFATQAHEMPVAQMKRGWPWAYQSETGREFKSKDGRELFLAESTAPALWQRISFAIIVADLTVFCMAAVMLRLTLYGWACCATRHERGTESSSAQS